MKISHSPLRYPGGKQRLANFVAQICIQNKIVDYVEPYAGGASVAISLLVNNIVKTVILNDIDRSIYAFWYSVLNHTEALCQLIEETDISIDVWKQSRLIQKNKQNEDLLTLGFSTFFLNRTNRSGIIKAGVIGGLKQDGNYLMNSRFNKSNLINKIKKIANLKEQIHLFNLDAIELIDLVQKDYKDNVILYLDPPYYHKANTLYLNYYKPDAHYSVSKKLKDIKTNWLISYDNVPEIQALYSEFLRKEYTFNHSAYKARQGQELLIFSPFVDVSNLDNPIDAAKIIQ